MIRMIFFICAEYPQGKPFHYIMNEGSRDLSYGEEMSTQQIAARNGSIISASWKPRRAEKYPDLPFVARCDELSEAPDLISRDRRMLADLSVPKRSQLQFAEGPKGVLPQRRYADWNPARPQITGIRRDDNSFPCA
jgi:hypothetical protein